MNRLRALLVICSSLMLSPAWADDACHAAWAGLKTVYGSVIHSETEPVHPNGLAYVAEFEAGSTTLVEKHSTLHFQLTQTSPCVWTGKGQVFSTEMSRYEGIPCVWKPDPQTEIIEPSFRRSFGTASSTTPITLEISRRRAVLDLKGANGINAGAATTSESGAYNTVMGCGPLLTTTEPMSVWGDSGRWTLSVPPPQETKFEENFPDPGAGVGIIFHSTVINLSPFPDATFDVPCHQSGSDIGCQNQSLGENIAINGTPFSLRYQSDRAPGRAGFNAAAAADAKGLGGWTLNVHHALDVGAPLSSPLATGLPPAHDPKTLFLGDGSMRSATKVQSLLQRNNSFYLTSADGAQLFVFEVGSSRHIETRHTLTGALIYTFGYDTAGNLVTVTDASGNVVTIARDASGKPTSITGPYGQVTRLALDAGGYLASVTDPAGHATALVHDSGGLLQKLTDANGHIHNFRYDTNGRLTLDSDPEGGSKALARTEGTAGAFSVRETTAMGRVTTHAMSVSQSAGSITQTLTSTGPDGRHASRSDTQQNGAMGFSSNLPDGTAISGTWGPDPRWGIQTPIATSRTTSFSGLTAQQAEGRSVVLATPGDPLSLVSQTDTSTVNGHSGSSVFTAATRTQVITSAGGRTHTVVYDELLRPVLSQVPGKVDASVAYDSHGRVASLTEGSRVSTMAYDADGRLSSVTNPLGQVTTIRYDVAGRPVGGTLADGRSVSYALDAVGNITGLTTPSGAIHRFAYSAIDRIAAYTAPSLTGAAPSSIRYTYNADHQLISTVRPDGATISYRYDAAGRRLQEVTPTATLNYSYDATTGLRSGATIVGGEALSYTYQGPLLGSSTWTGPVSGVVSRSYDNEFDLHTLNVGRGSALVTYRYDTDLQLSGVEAGTAVFNITRSATSARELGSSLGVVADTRSYDAYGELSRYRASTGSTELYAVTLSYDDAGRISGRTEIIAGVASTYAYQYDRVGRLAGVSLNGKQVSEYVYDLNSNRVAGRTINGEVNGRYDVQDRLLAYGRTQYSYTPSGELASRSVDGQVTSFSYDVFGALIAATVAPGNRGISYILDPQNRRVGKVVNGVREAGWLYDGSRIVAQLDGQNNLVSQFVYAAEFGTPAFMIRGGVVYRIISDHLGSARLVVNASTGAVVQKIDYDEFGVVLSDSNPGFQPFGYAGGLYDADTGLVRFGARDYDALSGRWTSKDPLLFLAGDTNLYVYSGNDPINHVDPSGLTDMTCEDVKQMVQDQIRKKGQAIVDSGKLGIGWLSLHFGPGQPPAVAIGGETGIEVDGVKVVGVKVEVSAGPTPNADPRDPLFQVDGVLGFSIDLLNKIPGFKGALEWEVKFHQEYGDAMSWFRDRNAGSSDVRHASACLSDNNDGCQ